MKVLFLWKALVSAAYHMKLEELADYDVDLHVIVPEQWNNVNLEIRESNKYTLIPRQIRLSGHHHFHWYPYLSNIIFEIKPDIVHIEEEPYSFVTFQAMRAAKKCGAKALFVAWQNIFKRYPFPFSWIERYNFNHTDIAVAGSEEVKGVLMRKGFCGEIAVIPLGVNEHMFVKTDGTQMRADLGMQNDDFVIGYMGRLVEEKGIGTLLDALAKLSINAVALLIGSGPYKKELLERASRLGIERRVVMIGQVSSFEVPRYMNCMDCLVLPSLTRPNWKEQFGRVLIEAMACEVPVVGSSSGEIPAVIGDAGLVFQEGHSDDLLKQLDLLVTDVALRRELSKKGRQRVLKNFTQKIIARKTYEVYKRILKE